MKRREFIMLIGAIAGWLRAVCGQQVMPVVGFLHAGSPEPNSKHVAAFRNGLSERDYIEGRNVTIEYRWAEGQDERLPGLATDLVRRKAAVIATPGTTQAALAAKLRPRRFRSFSAPVPIPSQLASLQASAGRVEMSLELSTSAPTLRRSVSDFCVIWCSGR